MANTFTNSVCKAIVVATRSEPILPNVELIDDYQLRVGLLMMGRDEEKLTNLSEQLTKLVEGEKYKLSSPEYMVEFEKISTQVGYFAEKKKRVAEVELIVDRQTGEKRFTILKDNDVVKKLILGENETIDEFFEYMQGFSKVIVA
ncbi:hypothetical protein [Domibacillus iocasae]|uniref:Uncharacterized protein n=1 Tax=Domibacillus iocasae TaxID=1714016 RepID=A0A1E7DRA6_9BACI|nr:hypothetical protein [Domibacillus iocasae]OES45525.1 hypothetical protein BA724_01520 [Domibacillus iocasae]